MSASSLAKKGRGLWNTRPLADAEDPRPVGGGALWPAFADEALAPGECRSLDRVSEFPVYVVGLGLGPCVELGAWISDCVDSPILTRLQWLEKGRTAGAAVPPGAVILHGSTAHCLQDAVSLVRACLRESAIFVLMRRSTPAQRAELLHSGADDVLDLTASLHEAVARLRACCRRINGRSGIA